MYKPFNETLYCREALATEILCIAVLVIVSILALFILHGLIFIACKCEKKNESTSSIDERSPLIVEGSAEVPYSSVFDENCRFSIEGNTQANSAPLMACC